MNWYYALGAERRGPVDREALLAEVQKGMILPGTLVWRDGLKDWVPYSNVEAELLGAGDLGRCFECGLTAPQDDLVQVKEYRVCAGCKANFVHKLMNGIPVGGALGMWRKGKELVVAKGANFPARCVKCNEDAAGKRLKRRLYWHHPALYLLILFPGLLIYALIAIFVRKKALLEVGLCDRHRSRRLIGILSAWVFALAGIGCFFLAASLNNSDSSVIAVFAGIGAILLSLIGGVGFARVVYAKKIEGEHAFVGGVCEDFLAQFPAWRE